MGTFLNSAEVFEQLKEAMLNFTRKYVLREAIEWTDEELEEWHQEVEASYDCESLAPLLDRWMRGVKNDWTSWDHGVHPRWTPHLSAPETVDLPLLVEVLKGIEIGMSWSSVNQQFRED